MKKKTKAGRPKTDNPRDQRLTILLTKDEYAQLEAKAKPLKVVEYARSVLLIYSGPVWFKPKPTPNDDHKTE